MRKVKITADDGREVEAMAPIIVSASRATDIPAFYPDWFFNRLKKGYCVWRNPFSGKDSFVSFTYTRFIVFWSKNPRPLIPYLDKLEKLGLHCYVQYTLNDYEKEGWEPGVARLEERIETFKKLSRCLGKDRVIWRFDPLILTADIGIEDLLHKISGIAEQLKTFTDKLVFSFVDIGSYIKVKRNFETEGVSYKEWSEKEMTEFALRLLEMNKQKKWNFQLATCGEKIDLREFGIAHNRCIDDELIAKSAWRDTQLMKHLGIEVHTIENNLFGNQELPEGAIVLDNLHYALRSKSNRATGQRKYCGCIDSKDIGQYNTCAHGCLYCYANSSAACGKINHAKHTSYTDSEKIIELCRCGIHGTVAIK